MQNAVKPDSLKGVYWHAEDMIVFILIVPMYRPTCFTKWVYGNLDLLMQKTLNYNNKNTTPVTRAV